MPEPVTKQFPLVLLTGRGRASQWHTQTRTSAVLWTPTARGPKSAQSAAR